MAKVVKAANRAKARAANRARVRVANRKVAQVTQAAKLAQYRHHPVKVAAGVLNTVLGLLASRTKAKAKVLCLTHVATLAHYRVASAVWV